jgi:putative colanic acid biosynthesis acetyltransferase WcaF
MSARQPIPPSLHIESNRQATKYSSREMLARVAWGLGKWLFRLSPRPCFAWRCWVLRRFGARIGARVHIYNTAEIYFPWNLEVGDWSAIGERVFIYNLGPVRLGKSVTLSWGARLCAGTHDYTRPDMPLLKPPVMIGDNAWICAEAFVGPNVTVGEGAVVGARAVAMKDVAPWTIVSGNPAQFVKKREMTLQ